MRIWRWLAPGLKVKRWVALICFSVLLLLAGASLVVIGVLSDGGATKDYPASGGLILLVSLVALFVAVSKLIESVVMVFQQRDGKSFIDVAYERRYLARGAKVVAFGGGTGMSNLLSGLKAHTAEITAVVSVGDDGGSSGRLREDLNMQPPGDVRNCLVALADSGPLMRDLLQYRFDKGELSGHSFGNIFLTVLTKLTGSFRSGVAEAGRLLSVRGTVVPVTDDAVSLVATHTDGTKSTGQVMVASATKSIDKLELKPDEGRADIAVLDAVEKADLIVFGPGSLYTSVLPSMLVGGVSESLQKTKALRVFVCNTMTQKGETGAFTVVDHIKAVEKHIGQGFLDAVVVNTTAISAGLKERYAQNGVIPVLDDCDLMQKSSLRIIRCDVLDEDNFVRHDSTKLAAVLMEVLS